MEDCPLCCEPLSKADKQYPLHCPTSTCNFQFCFYCLQQLAKSASDGYTEASDGSHQVKVALCCPQCRGEYCNKQPDSEFLKASSIVQAVLQLRQAAATPLPGQIPDSDLTATQLSHRKRFLEEVANVKILQDQLSLLQKYNDSLSKDTEKLPELDWEAWKPHLEEASKHDPCSLQCASSTDSGNAELVLPRDPTLFLGLEDLMTLDEQEFITSMLVSGQAETLAQAANLLQNITDTSMRQRGAAAVQQLSFTDNHHRFAPARPSKAQLEHQHRVRGRFPLPVHMPRSVTLPLYDPVNDRKPALEFIRPKDNMQEKGVPELTLAAVRGPAGRVGLRKGDVVTHVNGEDVGTMGEFTVALQMAMSTTTADFQLTVNANSTTALALRSRAQEMKKQKIRFH